MLYLFHGHSATAKAKAAHLADTLRAKQPDASVVHIEAGYFAPQDIEERLGGQGLFFSKSIVRIDGALSDATAGKVGGEKAADIIAPFFAAMAASSNIFILAEGQVPAAPLKAVLAHATKAVECAEGTGGVGSSESAAGGTEGFGLAKKAIISPRKQPAKTLSANKPAFNMFSIADAIVARDVARTMLALDQAWKSGAEPEQVHGIVVWQVKAMCAAARASAAAAAGLSPFVYSKAKAGIAKYAKDEKQVQKITADMLFSVVALAHEEWGDGLARGLERWVLERVG